jgi:stage V sporulation protein G
VKITEVRIALREDDKLKAFASVTFDDCFVVRGLKIISGNGGMFVAMPSRKKPDGTYQDIAHPINNEMRDELEQTVISEYDKVRSGNAVGA